MLLPVFVILGERRAGTSSLTARLGQHPGIFMLPKQDRGYFVDDDARLGRKAAGDWDETHSVEEYSAFFAEAGADPGRIAPEKSADYLFWRPAHERLNRYLPKAKFIVTLRNPVERAWSQYWNEVGKGRERLSFEAALEAESGRIADDPYAHNHLSYTARGFYDESLTHLFEQIDCSRVLVTTLERVIAEPAPVFREICEFLGIDPEFQFAELRTRRNANWTMTPRPWAERGVMSWLAAGYGLVAEKGVKLLVRDRDRRRRVISKAKSLFFEPAAEQRMSRETRASLEDLYRPHIAALGELLDRSFSEWVLGAPGT